ncbi:bifunctional phosphoglucose/phosphomannose isomerase [Candidatus Saccharibacteria bacterium]|nr:MAG: bifunctional phosphoglucose/phosphomannose isomerase [Candidatus Saccharibacteria bacterium]
MLDDINVLRQRDPSGVLDKAGQIFGQAAQPIEVKNTEHDQRDIKHIVIAGMGGSSLAADVVKVLLDDYILTSFEIIKGYSLPNYARENTLVIASSYSGNTEETLACFDQALKRGCQLAVITSGGRLGELAEQHKIAWANMPSGFQPRMAMIANLRATLTVLDLFGVDTKAQLNDIESSADWLNTEAQNWAKDMPTERNYAKQLALMAVGKTPVFYGGPKTAPIAYKWKISWNENAKNMAFYNQYPEFNHNEFIGWSSHPVEKPFVVFDIMSDYQSERINERMELSDRLLSGLRPKANQIHLAGESLVQEVLWGSLLADYASIYVAILNGVNPEPVALIEKFKQELS